MSKNLKIRLNIFETNSSSTHCVSFNRWIPGRNGRLDPESDGKIHVRGGDFGWEWGAYNDPETKINYYFVFYYRDTEMTNLGIKIIKDWTGCDVSLELVDGSYIDHQSCDTLCFDVNNPGLIKNFFFNPDTWLYTGNDNEDEPDGLRNTEKNGLISTGESWTIKFEYSLGNNESPTRRVFTKTLRLSGYPDEDTIRRELKNSTTSVVKCDMEEGKLILDVLDEEVFSSVIVEAKIVSIESERYGKIL